MFLFISAESTLQLALLVLLGFSTLAGLPILMVVIQESFPEQRSYANGFYMAGNFVLNSGAMLLVGWLGDVIGLNRAFLWSAIFSLVSLPVLMMLPGKNNSGSTVSKT
jgi:MFS transporter, FSR family, fosmidomycin resistance protein